MMIPKKREISGKNIYLSELIIHPAMLNLSDEFLLGPGNVRAFFAMFDQVTVGGAEEDFHGSSQWQIDNLTFPVPAIAC